MDFGVTKPLQLEGCKKIVFLTGAGISKASGLPVYRGDGGVWKKEKVEEVGTVEARQKVPLRVWRRLLGMYRKLQTAKPNAAHRAIAELQNKLPSECWVCVLTQNVDGLHQLAGSETVVEMHGSLRRLRCTQCSLNPGRSVEI